MKRMLVATAILLLLAVTVGRAEESPDEKVAATLMELIQKRNPMIRPSLAGEPTAIKVSLYINSLDVDEANQRVILDLFFRLYWNDTNLAFNDPARRSMPIRNVDLLWIPDIFFPNAHTTQYKTLVPERILKVDSEGKIMLSARLNINLQCSMDFNRYPHDTHECPLHMESYGYTNQEITLQWKEESPIKAAKSAREGKFSLSRFTNGQCDAETPSDKYSCISLNLSVKRDFGSYLVDQYNHGSQFFHPNQPVAPPVGRAPIYGFPGVPVYH